MSDTIKPDWFSMQYDSFQRFFSKADPSPELSLQSIINEFNKTTSGFIIRDWSISEAKTSPSYCIATNQSFMRELHFVTDLPEESTFGQTIMIPSPTVTGEFIFSSQGLVANCYVMIMEINRCPGIHYAIKETDKEITRTLILKPLIGKQYKQEIREEKLSGRQTGSSWGEFPAGKNFSTLGKKQMAHSLKGKVTIDTANPVLPDKEFDAITRLFNNNELDETDVRSWTNLKVNLIGDHLYRLLHEFIFSMKTIKEYEGYIFSMQKGQQNIEFFFRDSNLLQLCDKTNPLAELSQKRRLTFYKHPKFPRKGLLLEKRDVHPTDFGRLCPVESPQGKNLGFNLYLAKDAVISPLGTVIAPFKDIGSGEKLYIDPFDEPEKIKAVRAAGDINTGRVTFIKKPGDEVTLGLADSITHETVTPYNFLGYAASLIPFIQHNDASRCLMGANMMKQALLLRKPEPPLVRTGNEAVIAGKHENGESPFIIDNQLCLGTNLLVGYMPWDLLNYEDAIVISDKLCRQNILTHIEMEEIVFDQMDGETIDIKESVQVGAIVTLGTRLVKKSRISATGNRKYLPLSSKRKTEDCSLYAPEELKGVVKEVQIVTQNLPGESELRVIIKIEKEYSVRLGDKLTGRHGNKGVVSAIIPEREMPYFFGDTKGCSDQQCPVDKPHTHLEVLLNPLGITGRLNLGQLYETALGWIAKNTDADNGITVEPFSREWNWDRIKTAMAERGLNPKQKLFFRKDGKENEIGSDPESGQITVGYQYMMKLNHLAAKKITARSQKDSEYDLVYNQPIVHKFPATETQNIWKNRKIRKRKAQRLGEMEVWALAGHCAWDIIDELLFLKSDAEADRSHFVKYVKGLENEWSGFANSQREHRSLKTLIHYCRGLGLEIEALDENNNHVDIVGSPSSMPLPVLKSLSVRIAKDQEREDWANGNEIKKPGIEKDGLRSKEIFGNEEDIDDQKIRNAYGIIRLPIPIDNPLFSGFFKKLLTIEKAGLLQGAEDLYNFLKNIDWKEIIKKAKRNLKLQALICHVIQHGYTHDDFFIKNLLVLPKNLRMEIERSSDDKYPKIINDLNYLYKNIIETILEGKWKSPSDKVRNRAIEKIRILVHALLVNDKIATLSSGLPLIKGGTEDPYGSMLAVIAGYNVSKTGILRMHTLGKRTDFSGRAVIIPDPDLGLNDAGIPYGMAKILFQPTLIEHYLGEHWKEENTPDNDIKEAIKFIDDRKNDSAVRKWLDDVFRKNLIILNRAPSLHRFNMLSFRPCLHNDGDVIKLNPYVCQGFNADFDGDTMSIHVPMLEASKNEAQGLLPSRCLRSPANGKLIISHKADIGLGTYFLKGDDFLGWMKVTSALAVNDKSSGPVNADDLYKYLEESYTRDESKFEKGLKLLTKNIRSVLNNHGITIGLDDFSVTEDIENAMTGVKDRIYENIPVLSAQDSSRQIHDELEKLKSGMSADSLLPNSNLKDLINTRSVKINLMQLAGMKSYLSRPGGEEVPCPILSNIFKGLSPLEYFNSCHGSRYGLADKGLSTAVAGELTNILVQVAQDIFITEDDCGTDKSLYFSEFTDYDAGTIPLKERIIHRCLAEDVTIGDTLIPRGTIIDDSKTAELICEHNKWVKLRSPIFCKAKTGICRKCYGNNLSTGKESLIGYPAGIIAAQSIGEPGTQLSLKTFHGGGAAGSGMGTGIRTARKIFSASYQEQIPPDGLTTLPGTPNKMEWSISSDEDPKKFSRQYPSLSTARQILKKFGVEAVAEYLIFALQHIYNQNSKVSDRHFEIIIRKMLLLSSGRKRIRGIIKVGNDDSGVFAKLSFRSLPKVLMEAAISQAPDELNGLKERLIAGRKIR